MASKEKVMGYLVGISLLGGSFLSFGIYFLVPFLLLLPLLAGGAYLATAVIWVALPYLLYKQIIKLGDLTPGPIWEAVRWWLGGTYGLMAILLAVLLTIKWSSMKPIWGIMNDHPFLLWIGPMLGGLLAARVGLQRWDKRHNPQ